jgi:hypothetical protein
LLGQDSIYLTRKRRIKISNFEICYKFKTKVKIITLYRVKKPKVTASSVLEIQELGKNIKANQKTKNMINRKYKKSNYINIQL